MRPPPFEKVSSIKMQQVNRALSEINIFFNFFDKNRLGGLIHSKDYRKPILHPKFLFLMAKVLLFDILM